MRLYLRPYTFILMPFTFYALAKTFLSGRHINMIHGISGKGREIKNHVQKGLPKFRATMPAASAKVINTMKRAGTNMGSI